MKTTFAKWLRDRGETHSAYALRRSHHPRAVARLAGVSRKPYTIARLDLTFLMKISKDTSIPIDTLVDDAARAALAPVAPRSYTKKEDHDGKRTQAE